MQRHRSHPAVPGGTFKEKISKMTNRERERENGISVYHTLYFCDIKKSAKNKTTKKRDLLGAARATPDRKKKAHKKV